MRLLEGQTIWQHQWGFEGLSCLGRNNVVVVCYCGYHKDRGKRPRYCSVLITKVGIVWISITGTNWYRDVRIVEVGILSNQQNSPWYTEVPVL